MRDDPDPVAEDERPVVAIFRSPVFNASETFVRAQAAGLVRYRPLVVGLEDKGHVPPELASRVLLAGRGDALAIRALARWGSLGRRVAAERPVLVHAHFGTDGLLALPLARRLGVPLVTTLRGYDLTRSRRSLLMSGRLSWMRYALRQGELAARGDLFLAVSDALRRRAIARGFPAERLFTHYNGVDLARFRPGEVAAVEPVVLHVGRLVEKKGTALLLRAFAATLRSIPAARLVICGDGPLRRRLERLAGELGIAGAVSFRGEVSSAEIAALLRHAALLAAPSVTARDGDAEGLPNVVVEAAACGIPVVASDHGGIGEAVQDGRTGFLVPEGAVEPLARRMTELLAAPDLRRTMGVAARALAEQRFDAARQVLLLERRYDALVAGHAQPTLNKAIETR